MTERETIQKLAAAAKAYYDGKPVITDAAFDALYRDAKKAWPNNPYFRTIGAQVSGVKATHKIPMGSLDNVKNADEFEKWAAKQPKGKSWLVQDKLDGSSLEIIYVGGRLVQAITRGDGIEGEDVTANAMKMKGVPHFIGDDGTICIRGEVLLLTSDYAKHFPNSDTNARNVATGTLRRESGEGVEHLTFIAYDIVESVDGGAELYDDEAMIMSLLMKYKFMLPSNCKVFPTLREAWNFRECMEEQRDRLPYEVDGAVIKMVETDGKLETEGSAKLPKHQRALKYAPKGGVTKFNGVEWQLGQTGRLTAVAKVDPVQIGGVTITSISLHNLNYIKELGICIGDDVRVIRTCDVIPYIEGIEKSNGGAAVEVPTVCPFCKSVVKTNESGAYAECSNPKCDERQIQLVLNWVKKRNILTLGDGLVRALYDNGTVVTIADLYRLEVNTIATQVVGNGLFGAKRAKTVFDAIQKSRKCGTAKNSPIADFFGSLGIPTIGRSLMELAVKGLQISNWKDAATLRPGLLTNIAGFGESRANDLCNYLAENRDMITDLANCMEWDTNTVVAPATADPNAKSVCFTGGCEINGRKIGRTELSGMATKAGFVVRDSVGAGLTYLVMADLSSGSGKAQKAAKYGTECMTYEDFIGRFCK